MENDVLKTRYNNKFSKPRDNRLEDLNIKRGDAKFNSEVRPELRKLLGLSKTESKYYKI